MIHLPPAPRVRPLASARSPGRLAALAGALFTLLGPACLHVAQERAERDRDEVGHAEATGVRVDVNEGLAVVRRLIPGEPGLWANAPTVTFRLRTGDAPVDWSIHVENALPDARLDVTVAGLPLTSPVGSI